VADIFARADDLLVFSLLARKRRRPRHHAVKPEPARENKPNPLSNEAGRLAAVACRQLLNGEVESDQLLNRVGVVVETLKEQIPEFRSDELRWTACLQQ